jgi:hypothetical protein
MPDCKAKMKPELRGIVAALNRFNVLIWQFNVSMHGRLFAVERQHLSATIIPARRAGDVRRHAASALRAFVELRGVPAVGCLPRAQSHL